MSPTPLDIRCVTYYPFELDAASPDVVSATPGIHSRSCRPFADCTFCTQDFCSSVRYFRFGTEGQHDPSLESSVSLAALWFLVHSRHSASRHPVPSVLD